MFCWRKKAASSVTHDSDEELDKPKYVKQDELKAELFAKFGDDKLHMTNLKGYDFSSFRDVGSGAFSVVKIGYCPKYGKDVTVKVIKADPALTKSYVEKFLPEELRLWKALTTTSQCENILSYYEDVRVDSFVYILSEVADHGDLMEWIHRGTTTEAMARIFFKQIANAVFHCHSMGIAHRDIKPQNILLDRNNIVKLCDFSFATVLNPVPRNHVCGTPGYLSPEQMAMQPHDPFKADIWQLGITLFVMLFKNLPFRAENVDDLIGEVRGIVGGYRGVPIPKNKKTSTDCQEILADMINMNSISRFTARQVRDSSWLKVASIPSTR